MFTVLAIGAHYPATASRYLFDAFRNVTGTPEHLVLCGPEYNDHYGVNWGKRRVYPAIPLPREAEVWNIPDLIDQCTKLVAAPDLVLIGEETYRTVIEPSDRVPTVLLSYDGWPNSFERYHMVKPAMAYTPHPYGVRPAPRTEPDPNWKFLPPACDPSVHQLVRSFDQRGKDFVLYATMYGKRPALCDYLAGRYYSVLRGTVNTEDYVSGYNYARTTYHNCCYQQEIKYRFFEAAAMGVVNISDHTSLFEMVGAAPNVHYLPVPITEQGDDPYPAFEDIANRVAHMRDNPSLYRYYARAAFEWVMHSHTYLHRAQTILTDVGMHAQAAILYCHLSKLRKEI